ncbi:MULTISPECIES: DUF317 domain-containing protein [Pseudomonas fluorescens group]|uniref:DUF317 domain-containing protein n=1 Tax=Pseudomonas fluorescens TaxID=294 RepID=A0AAE2U0U5_PSEFL|nr:MULTISPECIES: DUF317 domain-containing protein [Pseudomonas fluorescens group]AZE89361.1 hypothetical protein C4J97_2660 [Pseudomonas orientalis]AZE94706.1 hypothetical protein C4J96_2590 [Pseudomonas orientalis]AZF00156.1 hypothetical protein C4J95_2695 [Pseudomonas orientalis]MBA1429839.1 hypothetical protein [Pseudomonas orientalis]MBD8148148.1 DUF317 domain-containing protein [Pseudomonas fluorescens]
MNDYPAGDTNSEARNRSIGNAIGLAADEVELWVTSVEEDGSGMGYVLTFSARTPSEVLAKVEGLGADRTINIGPID